ncbi:hypothetical protein RQP46_007816 [Phenoliferia psychrophenolica]
MSREFTYTEHAPISTLPTNFEVPATVPQSSNITTDGILHGLPTYPSGTGGTALVAGANGISGTHMLRTMAKHPDIWTRVDYVCHYVFSTNVKIEDKSRPFAEAGALSEENGRLLHNFLQAILLAGLKPKRILLQTGAKNYGYDLGPYVLPAIEDDLPRARIFSGPNFYYAQQDLLLEFCRKNNVEWCESRPGFICGVVKDNNLNYLVPLFLHAAISKHMGRDKIVFSGDRRSWNNLVDQSNAYHMTTQQEWQLLAPQAGNQAFNTTDGNWFGMARLFPLVAGFYGLAAPAPPSDEEGTWTTIVSEQPPALGYAESKATMKYQFLYSDWAKTPEVQAAWKDMCAVYDLDTTLLKSEYMWHVFSLLELAVPLCLRLS